METGSRPVAEFLERSRSCGLDNGLLGATLDPGLRGLQGPVGPAGAPGGHRGPAEDGE